MRDRNPEQHKIRSDERGSSLILIIVLMAFSAIILSVLMTNTMLNYQMKTAQAHSRTNFYAAERTLESVRSDITALVSDALSFSYNETLSTYASATDEAPERFLELFKERLRRALRNREFSGESVGEITFEEAEDGFYLKGFDVIKTDADGYTSRIRTDFKILFPDAAYRETHALMEAKDLVVYENFSGN